MRSARHAVCSAFLVLLASCGGETAATIADGETVEEMTSSPLSASSPYGVNAHRPTGDEANRLFDKVRNAGIAWVRLDVVWEDIEQAQGVFDWSEPDESIRAATDRGLSVFANLHKTPRWANGNRPGKVASRDVTHWEKFCREAVIRYDGKHGLPKVDVFGLWNEPDGSGFGEDGDSQTKKLDDYVNLILIPGAKAIREARSEARVAAPDLASETEFLSKMLDRAKGSVDIVTVHKYSDNASGVTDHMERVRTLLQSKGVGEKPLWLTETGWSTPTSKGCWFGTVNDDTQAKRTTELLGRIKSRTWIQKVYFYELKDDDSQGACQWGLLRSNESEKPSYRAYRDFIAANSSQSRSWLMVNSPNSNGNDFARVDGDKIGGTFARSSTMRYFVNTNWKRSFRRTETLTFSGEVALANGNFDGKFFIGFVDKNDLAAPASLVGLTFQEPAGRAGNPFRVQATVLHSKGDRSESPVFALSQNTSHAFTATWKGRPDGSGTLFGEISGKSFSIEQRASDESLNAFGIGVGLDASTVGTLRTAPTYFSKLKFSVP
jgi:hypothetical protein